MDIGMYFARVVLEQVSGTSWDQNLRNRKHMHFGQPIIVGRGKVPLNPVHIVVVLAYAFATKDQPPERLRALYDYWAKALGS